ncbi:MAG: 3-oxoacyl-ACP reductase FabG [Desulfarculales bacterium]|jgi:3-oxoacyl-[acyl-carrier protein] reductase|nr:3-oxoacyl-ACP reductase FabG [Desulfarculales bacterium]
MAEKKVYLVTGGSRGIGREICLALAGPDRVVAFTYASSEDSARQTEALIQAAGALSDRRRFDIASYEEAKDYIAYLARTYGALHGLVNNAALTSDAILLRMNMEQWQRVMDVNLTAPFVCMQAAAKIMIKQRFGCIVNLTSLAGVIGNSGQANYSASKGGLIALTKTAARELAQRNIRVNAVAPGFINTDMTRGLPEEAVRPIMALIPAGRGGEAGEVAQAVAFLCSDASSYLTGQVLHVGGGIYM